MARIVLVESSPWLPGLFPFHAWEALSAADLVWTRDPAAHPSREFLELADIPLVVLEPADLDLAGMDLTQPGSPEDRRYARALVDLAQVEDTAVYLLGPDDPDAFTRTVGLEATKVPVEVEFVFYLAEPSGTQVLRLVAIEQRLRDPLEGCPWDLEQDHRSLVPYLVEETYELLDAVESGDDAAMTEELGDVLLQVVFHAQVAADRGGFDIDDVARGIADKLVRRHPHVFGDVDVADAAEVKLNWDELKQQEKQRDGPFDGIPAALPALQLAAKLQRRAAKLGFDWRDRQEPADRIREELDELASADSHEELEEELGDLLGATVGVARHLGIDPELALRRAAGKFRRRFEAVLAQAKAAGRGVEDLDRVAWLDLWQSVKDRE